MLHKQLRVTAALNLSGDIVATVGAFFLSWYLRFVQPVIEITKSVPDFEPYLRMLPFIVLIWPTVYHFHGLYRIRRGHSRVDEAISILVATVLALVILTSVLTFDRLTQSATGDPFSYSRAFFALFAVTDIFLVALLRLVTRAFLRTVRRRGHNVRRILIVGAGDSGGEIAAKLVRHRELGYEVVGFLDDDPEKLHAEIGGGVRVLGTLDDLEETIEQLGVDQVMIALPFAAHRKILDLLDRIGNELIEIRLVPNVLQYATLRAAIEDVDGTPVINLSHVPMEGWSSLAKRTLDMVFAAGAMVALLPFLPVVMLLIKLEDRGPVFYRQERMSLDGRSFMILKFRSMREDAESSTGPGWTEKDDPRRTRIGAFLRRWSIDELPQLWNIFRGDMSCVGPRPERPRVRPEVPRQDPELHAAPPREVGVDGLGPGPRLARQHLDPQAHPVRPLLHRELESPSRFPDPVADPAPGPDQERVLAAGGTRPRRTGNRGAPVRQGATTRAGVIETTFAEETEADLFRRADRPLRRRPGSRPGR